MAKIRVTEDQIDTVVNYLIDKGVDPVQARKYALVVLGKSDISDIANETIGTINKIVNPNAITLPNPEDEKAITDYIIGATSENTVRELERQALMEAAPEYFKIKDSVDRTDPYYQWTFYIIDKIDKGTPWKDIQTEIDKANVKSTTPEGIAALKREAIARGLQPNELLTPFDSLSYRDARTFAKLLYDQRIAGQKNIINKKQKYLENDPFFTKGILPETFQYGLKTDYKNRTVAHPLAEVIKADADEQSTLSVESVFGFTPFGPKSDAATRRAAQSAKKDVPGFGVLTPKQLKDIAFKSAANQYLSELTAGGRTPALDMAEQRLLLGTIGK
jgi:hypothetical protein